MNITHRIDALHGVLAIGAFTVALVVFLLGLHILALGFVLCAVLCLWPQQTVRVLQVLLMALFTVAMVIIGVLLPWWLAHKTWVWIFGG